MYWVSQNVSLGYSIRCYRKTQMNFLANPRFWYKMLKCDYSGKKIYPYSFQNPLQAGEVGCNTALVENHWFELSLLLQDKSCLSPAEWPGQVAYPLWYLHLRCEVNIDRSPGKAWMHITQCREHGTCSVNGRNDDSGEDGDNNLMPILFTFPNPFLKSEWWLLTLKCCISLNLSLPTPGGGWWGCSPFSDEETEAQSSAEVFQELRRRDHDWHP